jgi:hypothetical protein
MILPGDGRGSANRALTRYIFHFHIRHPPAGGTTSNGDVRMSSDNKTSPATEPEGTNSSDAKIVIDVRFLPNGRVNAIDHRPGHIDAQDWFDLLCRDERSVYQPLSGGRGAFHVEREVFENILQEHAR